ncbi:MAG: polysaccharide deacetylase family protein [Ignavibacteriales bacterium]|nr:polysaccharide deacetylase family protein [Ignavibacteriales bacterium]
MKYLYNPPLIIKKIFRDFIWESKTSKILLTFDDGPNPNSTEIILKEFENHSIKTIFFCVGENLEKYKSLTQEILSQGHEIGNHTNKHQIITRQNKNQIKESISKVQNILLENNAYQIKYFRPPHGKFDFRTNKILSDFNLKNVMWSLLTYDYKNDINIVKFAVSKYLQKNSIIVLHDSNKSKDIIADSIKIIVEEVERKNYQFGKPSECLKSYS